jgi:AcrR family transcriptional regulator
LYLDTLLHVKTSGTPRLSRAERQARTRAALLDAAARVFVRDGFQGSSVEAIAAEAGYTRGAFYSNFDSKEELFAELLQERVFALYHEIAAEVSDDPGRRPTARALGERLAAMQRHPDGRWLFPLWLELITHGGRDKHFRSIAAGFWSANRALGAEALRAAYAAGNAEPPVPAEDLATAVIALDIGLAIQSFLDPEAAPLELYPELFDLLFGPLLPPPASG